MRDVRERKTKQCFSTALQVGQCFSTALQVEMAMVRFRVGYPRVSGLAGSGSGMIFDPRFSGSGPLNLSGSISDLVFHPWIPNG